MDTQTPVEQIFSHLAEHLTPDDDPLLWQAVIGEVTCDIHALQETHQTEEIFFHIGACSHWFRPHQSRWTDAGGFAWPSGWHGVAGFSHQGLPEFDWSALYEKDGSSWRRISKFSGKHRIEIRVAVPSRSARHQQAAIHSLWMPWNDTIFYGFRKRDVVWGCVARKAPHTIAELQ